MITIDYAEFQNNMEYYMRLASEGQEVVAIRQPGSQNILLISQKQYPGFQNSALHEDSEADSVPMNGMIRSSDARNIRHVQNYIKDHLSVHLSGPELVKEACMSLAKLKYSFKEVTGMTMLEYRNQMRLQKACDLLVSTSLTVKEIAGECGYQSAAALGNFFKKHLSVTPSKYRKKYQTPGS